MKPTRRTKIQSFLDKHIKSPLKKKKIVKNAYNICWLFERVFKRKQRLKTRDLFDYSYIFNGCSYFKCNEIYRANSLYGISASLRDYSSWNKTIKACIEHGVYFGETIIPRETSKSGLPGIITFSNFRNKYIRTVTNKPIIAIGPYIAYSSDYIDNYAEIKEKIGKTLLVFPTHSGEGITAEFDIKEFLQKVESFKKQHGFQTVMVCLYYNDILLGRHTLYEKNGYTIVSAGRRDDPLFLSRLKSFIKVSDYSLSNSVGTHIGYCVFLGKGHYLIKSSNLVYSGDLKNQAGIDEEWYKNKKEVENEFTVYHDCITDEQLRIVDKFWGLSFIKQKDELHSLLEGLEKVFIKSKKKENRFVEEAIKVFGNDSNVLK